jgi:signal peptidase I
VTKDPKKKVRFWDTWQALVLMVALILGARFVLFEPFKIPSGSMEPTLIGHEDYGDRIWTNKTAYWFGSPGRFEVVVFKHDSAWEGASSSTTKNYIKRLVGLPGETLVISGGDLFLDDRVKGGETILRKWEYSEELQERSWQPVARVRFRSGSTRDSAAPAAGGQQPYEQADFPWRVEQGEGGSWRYGGEAVELEVTGPATLTYAHPVTNAYVKMGRWPFRHIRCPMAHLPELGPPDGPKIRDPNEKSEYIMPYLPNSWSGVRCPNCGRRRFPLSRSDSDEPVIVPDVEWHAAQTRGGLGGGDYGEATGRHPRFFYGGYDEVGDLKLELELDLVRAGGALELEVGSNLHRAAWMLSLGGECPAGAEAEGRHELKERPIISPGRHALRLAYVDGTVLAALDGRKLDPLKLDVAPVGAAGLRSIARARLHGQSRVRITRLDLFRDLYHTLCMDDDRGKPDPFKEGSKDRARRFLLRDEGRFRAEIPDDCYMMLGDNSPSSSDSRVWGFVPKKNLVGRASFTWWPPSRWRIIY